MRLRDCFARDLVRKFFLEIPIWLNFRVEKISEQSWSEQNFPEANPRETRERSERAGSSWRG